MQVNIGISDKAREAIAAQLAKLLADTYTLYLKTHNFHWNVTGPQFNTLHLMTETQYTELALAVDQIAERIRALGLPAPGSYAEFAKLAARDAVAAADEASDEPTLDLLTQRMQVHEKTAWMLRSMLEE